MAHTPIPITDLTSSSVEGNGIFDTLMRAVKAHLDQEFQAGRIRGPEYSTVYLGALEATLQNSMSFLTQQHKLALENQLLEQQLEIGAKTLEKSQKEIEQVTAQIALLTQQRTNLIAEGSNIPKQGQLIDAQVAAANATKDHTVADTALVDQRRLNAITENTVLVAQECKLRAEYDVILLTKLKTTAETDLLTQKRLTEVAQVSGTNLSADSVLGRQANLYLAQTNGFLRDGEQKAAKLLIDTWNVRRTTDEGVTANSTNKLDDATIGRVVDKLLAGVQA